MDPETINTFEIAIDYRPGFDWKILFNLFSYEADNLIIFTPVPEGLQANNAGAQDAVGAEFEVHWSPNDDLDLTFGFALHDAENSDTKDDIADAPQTTIDASLNWKINDSLHWHLDSTWVKDRARLSTDLRSDIADYNWVNSNINYAVNTNFSISLSIRNLFNEDAREPTDGQIPEDFPLEERGYWLTTRYSF